MIAAGITLQRLWCDPVQYIGLLRPEERCSRQTTRAGAEDQGVSAPGFAPGLKIAAKELTPQNFVCDSPVCPRFCPRYSVKTSKILHKQLNQAIAVLDALVYSRLHKNLSVLKVSTSPNASRTARFIGG